MAEASRYSSIKLVFTDLDGTLYPGAHEEEPVADKPGLMRNMAEVARLEALGLPVVPATGNNVGFAQKKMLRPSDGTRLRDLSASPGIYCNGALVLGAGGREVKCQHVGDFIPGFLEKWLGSAAAGDGAARPPRHGDIQIAGLGKDHTLFLRWPGLTSIGEEAGRTFMRAMMIEEGELEWLEPEAFVARATSVLSLVVLLPLDWDSAALLSLQVWLHGQGLLSFADASGRLSNGEGNGVVCKHVHVPGIGPEVDISPAGVNKGSAIVKLLENTREYLGVECSADGSQIAVFGDAGNDIELFGMQRDGTGESLEPLELGYRPAIRVAMPWANDSLLLSDATEVATVDSVLAKLGG